MSILQIVAYGVAALIPIGVLYFISTRNMYQTGSFRVVLVSLLWGLAAFWAASTVNSYLWNNEIVVWDTIVRLVAPIEEEIFKALVFIYLFKRINFTYFVDAAVYGFSIGIGFAVIENFEYISGLADQAALSLAISRVISTNLIHASASSIAGMAFGRARFFNFGRQVRVIAQGLALAMVLHLFFNNLVSSVGGGMLLVYAAFVGMLATWYIIREINSGMRDAKQWIEEKLGMADRVTAGEAAMVNRMSDLQTLLAPIAAQFGEQKAGDVERFLIIQARLGILRKNLERLQDEFLLKETRQEMDKLREEMDVLRRKVGSYTMMTLRNMFPENDSPVLARLDNNLIAERLASQPASPGGGLWAQLGERASGRSSDE